MRILEPRAGPETSDVSLPFILWVRPNRYNLCICAQLRSDAGRDQQRLERGSGGARGGITKGPADS